MLIYKSTWQDWPLLSKIITFKADRNDGAKIVELSNKQTEVHVRDMHEAVVTLIHFVAANGQLLLANKLCVAILLVLVTLPIVVTWNHSHKMFNFRTCWRGWRWISRRSIFTSSSFELFVSQLFRFASTFIFIHPRYYIRMDKLISVVYLSVSYSRKSS